MLYYLPHSVKGNFDFFGWNFLTFLFEDMQKMKLVVFDGIKNSDGLLFGNT